MKADLTTNLCTQWILLLVTPPFRIILLHPAEGSRKQGRLEGWKMSKWWKWIQINNHGGSA